MYIYSNIIIQTHTWNYLSIKDSIVVDLYFLFDCVI